MNRLWSAKSRFIILVGFYALVSDSPIPANVIDVQSMIRGASDPGGLDFVNKDITFLIHDPMWAEFWNRDERILLGYPVPTSRPRDNAKAVLEGARLKSFE